MTTPMTGPLCSEELPLVISMRLPVNIVYDETEGAGQGRELR